MHISKKVLGLFLTAALANGVQAQQKTFSKTASGLEYLMLKDVPGKKNVQDGSYVVMHIRTKIADSAMFDSYKMNNNEPIDQQLTKEFLGDFMEGFNLLTEGDSALLRLPIEVAFKGSPMPPFAKNGDKVTYEVKVISVKSKEEHDKAATADAAKQIATDEKAIQDFIKKNKLTTQKTATGIHYIIERKGNGTHPVASDKVKVHYKGTKLDGSTFDSSYDRGQPIDFPLSGVIKGWTEGIPLFEEGGKGKLIIPSGLAYGKNAPPGSSIKANEVLVFDVELLEILKTVSPEKQKEVDDKIIQDYVKTNNLKTQKTSSGIYYIIEKPGNSTHPTATDKVKVHYKGTHLDGSTFDSSYDRGEPIEFPLSGVIKGWTEGIPLFGEGGKGKLIIPSGLAYGANSPGGSIKANEILIFDVELLQVVK